MSPSRTRTILIGIVLLPLGGCIRAERMGYERHLATVIAPSAPEPARSVALGVRDEPRTDDDGERDEPRR